MGNYFRYKIKPKTPRFKLPQLPPPPTTAPKAFKSMPPPEKMHPPPFQQQVRAWWNENWGVLVLNLGSICTLVGFTRSDVIELRTLSMMGSLSFVVFQYTSLPRRWIPIIWSSLFASVNAIKISQILHERNAQVVLSEEDQQVYIDFFLSHGLTPKQFEIIMQTATPVSFKKGQAIMRRESTLENVYLVVHGSTRASILGRHLTAVSLGQNKNEANLGGDSGAWIGEMACLEHCWEKEQNKSRPNTSVESEGVNETSTDENSNATNNNVSQGPRTALYTIVAAEDCELLQWSFEDMEKLFGRSVDMRGALTRAMTAAIVGKVINFTVSRKNMTPSWSVWLEDIRYKGAGTTYFVNSQLDEEAETAPATTEADRGEIEKEVKIAATEPAVASA